MELLMDFSVWIGLMTLVILEIVLGIDNLIFIVILTNNLPVKYRDKARLIGLSLALIMRLSLLSAVSWMAALTKPIFSVANFTFSKRDLIMLLGGIFLLFKATSELHDRLENHQNNGGNNKKVYTSFWIVVMQIVVLDVIFSLDAVITAVGMVNHLPIMMMAVVIATLVMLLASKFLTRFINKHPTIIVLCLSFLLMVGLSLEAEGLGFHIPKSYLYAAIGFSILIELFNQIARHNFIKQQSNLPLRARTADIILKFMSNRHQVDIQSDVDKHVLVPLLKAGILEEEYHIINGVLSLSSQSLQAIMTPRNRINWIDINLSIPEIRQKLLSSSHSLLPVCRGKLDEIIGVASAKEILLALEEGRNIESVAAISPAIIVSETINPINLLSVLRRAKERFITVTNEFGIIQGLVTPFDVLKAITGEFSGVDETTEIVVNEDH